VAVGKLCGRGQAMWPWASYVAVDNCIPLVSCMPLASCVAVASCAAVGKLCGGGTSGVFGWWPPQRDDDLRPYGYHYTITGLEVSPVGLPRQARRKSLPKPSDRPKKKSLLVRTTGPGSGFKPSALTGKGSVGLGVEGPFIS
jgi:hypothetical protein